MATKRPREAARKHELRLGALNPNIASETARKLPRGPPNTPKRLQRGFQEAPKEASQETPQRHLVHDPVMVANWAKGHSISRSRQCKFLAQCIGCSNELIKVIILVSQVSK
eukprot:9309548-Pyramimonas_sp.AAC.1